MADYYNVKESVKVEDLGDNALGGLEYSHPSYGKVSVSRTTGRKRDLFGSELGHNSTIRLAIHTSCCRQDLGRNWIHDKDLVVEIEMSPVQYAEMISNPNAGGTPCTIRHIQGKGNIKHESIPKIIDTCEKEIDDSLQGFKELSVKVRREVQNILSQKSIKKADKETILKLVNELTRDVSDAVPFYHKSINEHIERTKTDAKMEIEAYNSHAITTLGYEKLEELEKGSGSFKESAFNVISFDKKEPQ